MDKKMVARELLKLAKALVAGDAFEEASKKHDYEWVESLLKQAAHIEGLSGWGMSDFDSSRAVDAKLEMKRREGHVETDKASYSGLMPTIALKKLSPSIKAFFKKAKTEFVMDGITSEKTIEILQFYAPSRKTLRTEKYLGTTSVTIEYDSDFSLELRVVEKRKS